ncbi:MAG: GGDEF domain-containing protein [Desulfosudaceae bacterium]
MAPPCEKAEFEPGIYMPREQFAVRLLLAGLAALYFYFLPLPLPLLNRFQIGVAVLLFAGFHLVWWLVYRSRGAGAFSIRLAAWVDVTTAFVAVLSDPGPVPPTGLFVLIAVLGNGIQHGLRIFLEQFVTIMVLTLPVFFFRQFYLLEGLPYDLVFAGLFMSLCAYYSFLLVKRIESLKNEAENLARQDPLTGLFNRTAFAQAANYILSLRERNPLPLVIMFADLDNFKEVNDTMGHAVGDEVLRKFASLTGQFLRKSDVVARYGGDEFVFLLTGMSAREAELVAERLQREFIRWAEGRGVAAEVSFGISPVPQQAVSLDSLLKHVDMALYQAKAQAGGRNIVVASPLQEI